MTANLNSIIITLLLALCIHSIQTFELNAQRILEINIDGEIQIVEFPDPQMSSLSFKGVTGQAIMGNRLNRISTTGCVPYKTSVVGLIPLVKSGGCSLDQKVNNAADGGAVSLIICNPTNELINFSDHIRLEEESGLNIIFLDQSECNTIEVALENNQRVDLRIYKRFVEIIWGGQDEPNSTFQGGLNDWTTGGANGNLWYHSIPIESNLVPEGWSSSQNPTHYDYSLHPEFNNYPRYYGTLTDRRIISESLDKGFAMLDLDSYNNTEFNVHLENPVDAQLISPAIDLSGYEGRGLALRYTQSLRYCCNTYPYFQIKVSLDGFNTYFSFDPASEVLPNQINRHEVIQFPIYELLEEGADLSNFQVKFIFDPGSSHYFWMIDDVQIVELPDIHISINNAVFPLSAVCYPSGHGIQEELNFALTVTNEGGVDQEKVAVTVELREKESGRILHSHTDMIHDLQRGTSLTHVFDDSYFLEEYHKDEFLITYRAEVLNSNHFNPDANNISYFFKVGNSPYANEDCSRTQGFEGKSLSNTSDWYWGNAFYIRPSLQGLEFNGWFNGAEIALIKEDIENTHGNPGIFLHLMKLNQRGKDAFEQLNTSLNVPPIYHPDFTPLAIAPIDPIDLDGLNEGRVNAIPYNRFISVLPPYNTLDYPLAFKADHYYFLFVQFSGLQPGNDFPYSIAYNPNNHQESRTSELVYIDRSLDYDEGYMIFDRPYRNPVIRLMGDLFSDAEGSPSVIKSPAFYLYPLPARDELHIQFSEPLREEVTVELFDISGKLVDQKVHSSNGTSTISKNVTTFNSGTYLLRVISENGVLTQKVVIMR